MANGERNGIKTVLLAAASVLLVTAVCGALAMYKDCVTEAQVSKQIQLEASYVKDRALIQKTMQEDIPQLKADVRQIREAQTEMMVEQRFILAELKRISSDR